MKRKIRVFILFILLLVSIAPAIAGEGVSPEQLISMAQGTRAMEIIVKVFGNIQDVLEEGPLSRIFLILNGAVGLAAAVISVYNILSFTVEVSHEGVVFGKRVSKWAPIRNVFGLITIFPIAGGYCLAQKFILIVVALSIGLANIIWLNTKPLIIKSAVDRPLVASVAIDKDRVMQALLRAQVCKIAYNSQYYDREGNPLVDGAPPAFEMHTGEVAQGGAGGGLPAVEYHLTYGGTGQYDYAQDYCGGVSIPSDAIGSVDGVIGPLLSQKEVLGAQVRALTGMATDLMPISSALYYQHKKPDPARLAEIKNKYNTTVSSTIKSVLTRNASVMQDVLQSFANDSQKPSWIEAGFTFNSIQKVYRDIHTAVNVETRVLQPLVVASDTAASRAADGIALANSYIELANPDDRVPQVGESTDMGDKTTIALKKIKFDAIYSALGIFLAGGEDLLSGMANFGYSTFYILITGLVTILGFAAAAGVLSTTAGLSIIGYATLILLAPIAFALSCAFYLPLVPMIYWYSGVLSWLVLVAEGIVAAPIWALAHLDLDGGHGMGPRTEHGYLYMLKLFFFPSFMVVGLVLAFLLSNALAPFLRFGLSIFFASGSGDMSTISMPGIGGIIMFLATFCLCAFLAMYTIKKLYSLIFVLPDQAVGWIGSRAANIIGGDIEGSVSQGMGGAAHTAGSETSTAARTGISDRKAGLGRGGGISKGPGEG